MDNPVAGKYHAQQCYHEGCQWKAKQAEIDRLRAKVTRLEQTMLSLRFTVEAAIDGATSSEPEGHADKG
jgi:NADH:ubiquinone oxidoreductase subunit E